jgi:hypothetical protein
MARKAAVRPTKTATSPAVNPVPVHQFLVTLLKPLARYPRCVASARACPPEDCGGIGGYEAFLLAIGNPKHPDHKEMREWFRGPFNPDAFDPTVVVFDDPRRRWAQAFAE